MIQYRDIVSLDLLILGILNQKDYYVYEMYTFIDEKSEGKLNIKEGVLYASIYKLLNDNYISKREEIINGRVRVYYHLEPKGKKFFNELKQNFESGAEAIRKIIYKGGENG